MTETTTPTSILVVDDKPENLHFLVQALSNAGYKPRPVKSGKLALEGARRDLPGLVLLDINMPGMDGYAVCAAFKADEKLRDVPIIFLSALDDAFDKVKALEAGGVDYVTKPFQMEEVLARVHTHLQLRKLQIEREQVIEELQAALKEIQTLRSIVPVCANCKGVRNDKGYWESVEEYMKPIWAQAYHTTFAPHVSTPSIPISSPKKKKTPSPHPRANSLDHSASTTPPLSARATPGRR